MLCAPRTPQGPRFRMWGCSWQLQPKRQLRQSSLEVLKLLLVGLASRPTHTLCSSQEDVHRMHTCKVLWHNLA